MTPLGLLPNGTPMLFSQRSIRPLVPVITILASMIVASAGRSDDSAVAVQPVRCRVTGLFQPDRTDDLREALKQWPEVTLMSVDFGTAEAAFTFDAAKAFPGAKPAQLIEQFNSRLRGLTNGTLGVRAICDTPREKLQFVEIPIFGLDCKGCSFAAYEAIYRLNGVEQAMASFKDGKVTAWIDPGKTDREKLEAALKARHVPLKQP